MMKTFMLVAATAIFFFSFAACRKPDLHDGVGTRELAQPPEVQTMNEKNRGSDRTTANGGGMQNYAGREIIVKFKAGTAQETVAGIAVKHDLELIKTVSAPHVYLFRLRGKVSVPDAVRSLNALGEVEYAEPNYTRQTQ